MPHRAGLAADHAAAAPAIELGLQWLRRHQDQDGRWSAAGFAAHDGEGDAGGAGRATYDLATTGLVLFALAREGIPNRDQAAIGRGARWLADQQQDNGLLGTNQTHDLIYGHAIGTLGLCAAVATTGDAALRQAAQRALDYLEAHRNPYSVWRYQPRDNDNDSSVTTWATLAWLAGRELGLDVNRNIAALVQTWFDAVTDRNGRAGYTRAGEPSSRHVGDHPERFPPEHGEAMTAAALLLEKKPEWRSAERRVDHCYWFFATEALRRWDPVEQTAWGRELVAALVKGQRVDGTATGSWDPVDPWDEDGGRVYSTALSVLALQGLHPWRPAAAPQRTAGK